MTSAFDVLDNLARRPEPFAENTIRALWTRPYLARKMLEYHLSQDTDHSSRRIVEIERIVAWLDDQLDLTGKRIIDLGCGPGLYVSRLARTGARVTGVDFSPRSIEYARERVQGLPAVARHRHLEAGLLEEVTQVARKYADRADLTKIPATSTWTTRQKPGVPGCNLARIAHQQVQAQGNQGINCQHAQQEDRVFSQEQRQDK